MQLLIKRHFLHSSLVWTPVNHLKLPTAGAAATFERSRTQEGSRADLPQAEELEKDFTELMMSDTSASVSEPSQWVRHVAPLPGEGTQGLSDSGTSSGSPLCCRGELPHHCLTPLSTAASTLRMGHYKISTAPWGVQGPSEQHKCL